MRRRRACKRGAERRGSTAGHVFNNVSSPSRSSAASCNQAIACSCWLKSKADLSHQKTRDILLGPAPLQIFEDREGLLRMPGEPQSPAEKRLCGRVTISPLAISSRSSAIA